MIYLDSSALLKLLHEEAESAALEQWLRVNADLTIVSSELARIEVMRACRRVNVEALPEARAVLESLDLIRLSTDIVNEATEVGDAALRSLDAIHLASALSIRGDLSAFVAYDHRLVAAAATAGLESLRPGT